LDVPVDHAARACDARLDPAVACGASAAGALQRDKLRRQRVHLHRRRRAALQALLAGVDQWPRPVRLCIGGLCRHHRFRHAALRR
jgi:hypothetical protein